MTGSTSTILMLLTIGLIYVLPTLIAFGREHPRRHDIAIVNILFGWTLIGWIACFLWALLVPTENQPGL